MGKWIGLDFDQTLRGTNGLPVLATVMRIRNWIRLGYEIRIVSARLNPIDHGNPEYAGDQKEFIQNWCKEHLGVVFPVQWGKSSGMIELWDDKVVRVEPNTGIRLSPSFIEGP